MNFYVMIRQDRTGQDRTGQDRTGQDSYNCALLRAAKKLYQKLFICKKNFISLSVSNIELAAWALNF